MRGVHWWSDFMVGKICMVLGWQMLAVIRGIHRVYKRAIGCSWHIFGRGVYLALYMHVLL